MNGKHPVNSSEGAGYFTIRTQVNTPLQMKELGVFKATTDHHFREKVVKVVSKYYDKHNVPENMSMKYFQHSKMLRVCDSGDNIDASEYIIIAKTRMF